MSIQDVDRLAIESDVSLSTEYRRVRGTDASDREYQWWFAVDMTSEARPTLIRVLIDGRSVPVTDAVGTSLIPMSDLLDKLAVETAEAQAPEEVADEYH